MYFYNVNVTTHRTNEIRHNIIQTHDTAKLGWRYHTDIPDTCNHCTYCVSVHQLDANCVCLVGNLSIKSVLVRVWYFQMTIFTLSSFKWLSIWADGWWTRLQALFITLGSPSICVKKSQFSLAPISGWQSSTWHILKTISCVLGWLHCVLVGKAFKDLSSSYLFSRGLDFIMQGQIHLHCDLRTGVKENI